MYRVGTTSYIYPDHILPNVRKLKDRVDDIELVLFESEGDSNIPDKKAVRELVRIARSSGLTYTVHLPLDIDLGSSDKEHRETSVSKAIEIINRTSELDPFAYILHLNLPRQAQKHLRNWQNRVDDSLAKMLDAVGVDPRKIVVENLGYPFEYVDRLIPRHGLSVCIDIGHLVITGTDVCRHMKKYLSRTRVIHWHGVNNGRDHVSLAHSDPKQRKHIMRILKEHQFKGVVTLEVFNEDDLLSSLNCV